MIKVWLFIVQLEMIKTVFCIIIHIYKKIL